MNRRYFTFQSSLLGPVFNRIWDTPHNGYAEKFKHSVEPFLIYSNTTAINNYDRIVKLDGLDSIIGGVNQYTYGVTNRVYAKRPQKTGPATAVGIFSIDLRQTYYTTTSRHRSIRSTRPVSRARRRATFPRFR